MLKVYSQPNLRQPALLCAFSGWADAASAASGALRYVLLKRAGNRIAEFNPDALYVYTITRPLTITDGFGRRQMEWPELAWVAIEVPEAPRDLVVLIGPEPDLRWRECVQAVGAFAERLGVSQVLAFGAFLAQVHYLGPVSLTGVSLDAGLRTKMRQLGVEQSNYQGPTSFISGILKEASDRGIPAASVWVAAPNYLANTSNPKLSAALLKVAEQLLGQSLWRAELESAGIDMERRIERALRQRPDLVNFLEKLSQQTGAPPPPTPEVVEPQQEQDQDLPSAEEVLRDLEEHLRRLKGDAEGPEQG